MVGRNPAASVRATSMSHGDIFLSHKEISSERFQLKKLQDSLKHWEPTKVRVPGCLLRHNSIGNCLAFSSHYLSFCSAKTSLLFCQVGEQPVRKCHFPNPNPRHLCFLHLGEQENKPRKLNSPGKCSIG